MFFLLNKCLHFFYKKKLYVCNDGISAEAASLLADILLKDGCPRMETFNFYNNMCGNGGASAIARIVNECPTIQDFRYSATRSNPVGGAAITQSLTALSNLKKLDLCDTNLGFDNVGETIAQII